LRKARTEAPALIVLDLMLPRMSGLEVCKLLRADSVHVAHPDHHADRQGRGGRPHCRVGIWGG
jgi:CheY-like chemotaxis protein